MEAQNSRAVCQLDDADIADAKKPARGGLFAERSGSAATPTQQAGPGQAQAQQRQRARLRHLGADFMDVADTAVNGFRPRRQAPKFLKPTSRINYLNGIHHGKRKTKCKVCRLNA
jgi:hypothetical protein